MSAGPSRTPALSRSTTGASTRGRSKNVVMASHGRAPWYGPDGKTVEAYVIGIAGGSASGKTSVARAILSALNNIPTVLILSQDSFYRHHTPEEIQQAFNNDLDLDHPDSIDVPLFEKCLRDLKQGKATEIPVYSFVHHQRMPEKKYLYGASVIIVEGIMALNSPEMRSLYDLKVFVNCDSDLMLARRIKRDIKERGRDIDGILDQPSSRYADVIVPGSSNQLAIEILVGHVKRQLDSRSLRFRKLLARDDDDDESSLVRGSEKGDLADAGVVLLEQTNQLRGIMTILRDDTTQRSDFIFYADRLSTLIVEKALTLIPYAAKTVRTPLGIDYKGVARTEDEVVGISILRSGGPFSHGLRRVIRDVPIGAMLIQSDPKTGEPLLLSSDLPPSIKSQESSGGVRVLLLDSQMGTGAAAMMAIRVLLDHGVPQSHIIFLTFLISRRGLCSVRRAFPSIRIVTAAIDPGLHEMHLPLTSLVMGEAAGEADFAVRLVDDTQDAEEAQDQDGTLGYAEYTGLGDMRAQLDLTLAGKKGLVGEGFRVPVRKGTEELMFSRRHRRDTMPSSVKRAWVVSPGMGHIGDRYYTV
ncbi:Uridine kinase [Saitozyma podzolica]|uniref:uridine/cytidine kinase n=1 Tax=Saitozyma podzolica TaxID=1890683 RepID=A0A427Y3D3_9TREE|nr:Uridine kinase [Saitozyma podzolica]